MRNLVTLFFAVVLAACASAYAQEPTQKESAPADASRVVVERIGDRFRATFDLQADAPVWAFHRSSLRRADEQPWRPDSWQIVTPKVAMERFGEFDVFVSVDGDVPRTVVVEFAPPALELIADYDPALVLTDGTTALFAGSFTLFPGESGAEIAALDYPRGHPTEIVFEGDVGGVFLDGESHEQVIATGSEYAIYGPVSINKEAGVATLLDPALPQWLSNQIEAATPIVFEFYGTEMGPHASTRPLVLASWVPSEMQGVSQGGSVLPGMITMRFEGSGLNEPNDQVLGSSLWFIAHEAAHFWLGETIHYDTRDRMWITEGGADLMAMRATEQALGGFSASDMIAQSKIDCAQALHEGGVEDAWKRNAIRPYYDCGAVFALAVEQAGASRGEDYFDFIKALIANQTDREVNGEEWLAAAAEFGLEEPKLAIIRRLLREGSREPNKDIGLLVGA